MAREPLPRFTAQRRSLQNCAAPIMPRWLNIVACRFVRCFVAAALALPAVAAPVRTAHVEAELVPEQTALSPGRPLTVALRLAMERGWHTYWQNPGESGLPTTLTWKLPDGLSAGPIQWPPPRALPVGPLTNYGYEGEVLLLTDIVAVPDFLSGRTVTLNVRADWLVCKEICIPEGANLSLALPVANGAEPDPRWAGAIARTRATLPRPLEGWDIAATGRGSEIDLALTARAGGSDPGEVRFFPFNEGKIEASAPQILAREGSTLKLTLPVASQRVGEFTRVAGVLAASKGFGDRSAATIDVPLAGSVVAGPSASAAGATPVPAASGADLSFRVALVFALVGGVLLNLMPCVFPVLSLKVFGFAAQEGDHAKMRAHGLAFGGGVIVSCWRSIFPACSRWDGFCRRRCRCGARAMHSSTTRFPACSRSRSPRRARRRSWGPRSATVSRRTPHRLSPCSRRSGWAWRFPTCCWHSSPAGAGTCPVPGRGWCA